MTGAATDFERIFIIGIGDDGLEGLSPTARTIVDRANLIIGPEPILKTLPNRAVETLPLGGDLDLILGRIRASAEQRIVLLALGDPLFYGTARFLIEKIGKDRFTVVPHVSSMQLAFARVKESWEDAYLCNLATQNLSVVIDKVRTCQKAGIFTTEEASPAKVARSLLDQKIDYYIAYVCENLGSPDERVTQGELSEIAEMDFAALNVMVLVRKPNHPDAPVLPNRWRLFGNKDELFQQNRPKRGLLTPAEVRAIALSEMAIHPNAIVWDVGAGSGSVAIEAARLAPGGQVFAIDSDPDSYRMIRENCARMGVHNVVPVQGLAPDVWADLPSPSAVFVGGTGRAAAAIARAAFERLQPGGHVVCNVGSIERLVEVRRELEGVAGDVEVLMVSLARAVSQLDTTRFEALNPTYLVTASKLD